ncbi:nucleoside/nucleotide kinase family protein [Terracoccus luteus]|uniref:Pantothenate kinase n=1 Tax=Terracoccus luteus TaxID=53356 RepID=A0A839PVN8_9MICO|nr:nucleoside/nucleotide kinase family protein [Terracoccus luteus]MBB2987349.1 pantothenate kinase [Terracoccus luteus]MCP2173000.1 pantothenate kinase [Terracoccus luteus]
MSKVREVSGAQTVDAGGPAGVAALAAAAVALVPEGGRALLGIAGAPGAGKTTLAEALVAQVAAEHGVGFVAHVPMDGYHLADVQLERLHALSRKGAPDTFDADGYAHLLRRIREERDGWVYAPGFDRTLEQPLAAAMVVPPTTRLVVTEGNYLLLPGGSWPRARAALDEVWFVTVDEGLRHERLVARHVTFGKQPHAARTWVETSDQPNADLVAPSLARADRVVHNGPEGWLLLDPAGPAR